MVTEGAECWVVCDLGMGGKCEKCQATIAKMEMRAGAWRALLLMTVASLNMRRWGARRGLSGE